MGSRRRNSRLRLQVADLAHAEPGDQVGEAPVMLDQGHAPQRRSLLFPARDRLTPALVERFCPGPVGWSIAGVDLCQSLGERLGDLGDVAGISMDVRIAAGMHVSHRAVDLGRNLELQYIPRRLEVAGRARLQAAVARLREKEREPGDLQLR